MNQSESIGALAQALSKVQGQLDHAKKDAKGQYGKFADLKSILDVSKELLTANGLALVQTNNPNEKGVELVTTLLHESGEWIKGTIFLPSDKMGGVWGFGSAMTYARRYGMAAILGISQEDDDGQKAQDAIKAQKPKQEPQPKGEWTLKLEELEEMEKKGIISKESVNSYRKPYSEKDVAECARIYNAILEGING